MSVGERCKPPDQPPKGLPGVEALIVLDPAEGQVVAGAGDVGQVLARQLLRALGAEGNQGLGL